MGKRKDEIVVGIQEATSDLESIVSLLPEARRLGVQADLIESCAQDLMDAAHSLRQYATDEQELQTAVQNAKKAVGG